jgi:hypothetical protein
VPDGALQLLYLDSGLKPISQTPPPMVQVCTSSDDEIDTGAYETVEDALDREDRPVTTETDYLTEYNRLNLRRKRLRNIREAKLASRLDAQLETVNGLITDSAQRLVDLDQVTKIHLETQTGLTKQLAQEVIKAAPPPAPPDLVGAIERGIGHLAHVVMAAIGAKSEKDAPKIKKLRKKIAKLEKAVSSSAKLLPEPNQSDEPKANTPPPTVEKSKPSTPDTTEQAPKRADPLPDVPSPTVEKAKPSTSDATEQAPKRDDSDDPPSAPPPIATPESAAVAAGATKAGQAPSPRTAARRDRPYTAAWNQIKRVVSSLSDGEITMFVAQPKRGLDFLALLAELCPGGALATC